MGKIFQSAQTFELAAKTFEQFQYPDFDAVQFLYKPLGNNYIRLGDDDKALSVFQKALALGGDHESLSGLYCDIGLAYWNKGDPVAAEDNFRHGLSLNGVSSLKRALLLGALAQTQLDEGQTEASAVTAAQSLALLQKVKSESAVFEYRCYSRRTAGIAHTRLGRYKEAEQLLSGALADALMIFGPHSRDVGKIEVARAQLELSQNKPIPAIHAANRALAAVIPGFKPGLTNPQAAQFYEENTIFEALTVKAAAAQALFEKTGELHWLELSLECHDLAWQAESMLRRVFQYSSSKLNLQKDARAREEAAMNVARMLFEKTGQAVWLEKAFAITERSKATILLEALQDNLLRQQRSGSDTRFENLNILRQSLSYFDKNLLLEPGSDKVPQWRIESDGIRAQITTLEQALRKAYPNLAGFETPTANWLPASGDLSAGEALVGYFMSVHWVDVFVFQKDQPLLRPGLPDIGEQESFGGQVIWHRIPNDAALQSLIQGYLAYFANDYAILNDPDGYFRTAYTLWQKLLPPETAQATILTILPDGVLNFVPFEALVATLDETPTLRNAAYLLRKQEVRYAWSLAVLRQQKELKSRAPNYLLSIAPGFANHERGLAPLATTDFDWRGISGWDIQKLEGQHADLQHFLKASSAYRVLHFSTHAFAGGNLRIELMDGSLLLPDLYALPLQADLVMLSACETGLGKEAKGEGVMSLARAFAQAGAACIVSSLWSVNDQSTSRLLRYFYDNIKAGQSSASALRAAKLAYLSDPEVGSAAQSPYFWAGLVMVGDDRVVEQPWGWVWWGMVGIGIGLLLWSGRKIWQRRLHLLKYFL
jgi:CHAT domain-containing protein